MKSQAHHNINSKTTTNQEKDKSKTKIRHRIKPREKRKAHNREWSGAYWVVLKIPRVTDMKRHGVLQAKKYQSSFSHLYHPFFAFPGEELHLALWWDTGNGVCM
jgi:hypothetical protein